MYMDFHSALLKIQWANLPSSDFRSSGAGGCRSGVPARLNGKLPLPADDPPNGEPRPNTAPGASMAGTGVPEIQRPQPGSSHSSTLYKSPFQPQEAWAGLCDRSGGRPPHRAGARLAEVPCRGTYGVARLAQATDPGDVFIRLHRVRSVPWGLQRRPSSPGGTRRLTGSTGLPVPCARARIAGATGTVPALAPGARGTPSACNMPRPAPDPRPSGPVTPLVGVVGIAAAGISAAGPRTSWHPRLPGPRGRIGGPAWLWVELVGSSPRLVPNPFRITGNRYEEGGVLC